MKDDFDLRRLAEIPDPFLATPTRSPLPMDREQLGPSRARTAVKTLRVTAVVAALVYDAAWPVFFDTRPDLASLSSLKLALALAIPLTLAWVVLGTVRRTTGAARIAIWVLAAPPLYAMATWTTAPVIADGQFWRHAEGCMAVSAMLAAGPIAFGIYAFHRAFVSLSAWRAAALGVAGGALAAATMSLSCPMSDARHVVIGHGAMMLFGGVLGAALGPRWCRA